MDEENTEYIKLPVTERCTHKNWKARVHGYTEAAKIFQQIDDEKSPEWNKFLGLVKKFVIDSNVVAQEKGLEAVLAFVENSAVAGKTVGEVMSGIVAKCIGAPKAKTKELAAQITLMYIEQEKQELVIEELLKGTEHKNPKVVCGCINVITQAIREFGVKVINVKPLVKKIPSLLEDRDKGVRDEGKAMVVEMHRWIGPALTPQLSALKPVQMTELGQEFEKAHGEKATPTRYLRSQQVRQAKEAAEQGEEADRGAGDDEEEAAGQDIDPYELMEPVNILAKLPKDFYDKVEAKKWQERKETMETLEAFLKSAPKLENGDYFELVKALKRLIGKDSNVVVVALATKNLGGLASGLKKRFSQYASTCIPVLLEKFREKKANVVTALRETIDAVYQATTLEAIHEDVLAALDNKNPSVKAETAIFLSRCFQRCTTLILTKKLLKVYTAALCKTLNESDPTVRDNSAEALGTAMKVVSEKAITPFLENVDSLKLAKIKECSEKAEILVKQPTVKPAPAAVKTAAKPSAGSTAPKAVKRPASASGAAAAGSKTQKAASGGGAGAPARKGAASNAGKGKSSAAKVATERELSDEEVLEKAEAILSSEILNGLADANWKTRLAVMEQFTQIFGTLEPASVSSQVLFKILNKKPGIKDTNFQVAKLKLEAVKMITTTFPVTSVGVNCVLLDIVDKLNEAKTVTIASECLTELSEATKLEAVSTEVLDYAMNRQKSPKVQVEVFNWLSTALLEFGFQVNAKALMENVKKGVAATSQVVRTAAISLLGTLYVFMGPQLHLFFENEKPALVQQINAECDKRTGETAPAPVRGLRRARSQDLLEDGGGGGDDPAEEGVAATVCIQDIVPRTDITGYITDALVSELQDKNWKVRSEAIQKLQNIINELRFISGSLGEVAPLLGARLVDSNSKIAQNAIALCESIATAAGTAGAKQYVRYVFPGLLQCTGDSKAWIRTAAVSCINTYGELCGYKEFFEGEMIYDALKGGSPALRAEVWSWLSVKLPNMKTVPKEELLVCLPVLYANLEDRNADVRKNASEALIGFMYHLGYSPMMSACEKLKPASSSQVRGLLDKARCLVPDRPTPASKAKGAGSSQAVNSAGAQAKAKLAPGSSATITKSSSKAKTANAAKGSGSAGSRKEEEVDVTPLLPINNQKNQRVIDEQKLKTLKWNFTTPRDEFVELLRDQMTAAGVNKALIANMFHPDFKYHLKAIDQLNEDLGTNLQSLACNLDLILRWMTLRFFDTNPSVILKGLEYLQTAFNMLIDDDYILLENEASAFIPYLVLKVGDPKDAVRNSVRALFKQIVLMYPVSKMFTYIMDGLKSKNARQRSECLEQLGSLIETIGTTVCQPSASVALKEIAKHISDRDNSVRNGAINCIVAAYFLDGEKVLKTVGQISDKDMSLLEERIKRAAKNRPVASIKPMPVQQQPQQQSRPASAVRPHAASPPSPEPVDEEIDELQQPEPTPQNDGGEQTLNSSREYESSGFHPVERNDDIDDENVDLNLSSRSLPPQPVTGPYRLDPDFLASIEVPVNIQRPQFKEVDLSFLQEPVPQLTRSLKLTSTSPLSKLSHPSTIEWQIQQIGSPNLETALTAMSQIETVLLSEKRNNLQDHVDKFVTQLVNQLIFLNQSNHPDLVSCYRLNFSLLMKLYYYPELSCKVSESVIKDVINQLISLLTEKKLEMYDSTEMFVKVVNCLVLRILERSEHTASTCALLKLLYDTVNSDTIPSYQELIMKCIWRVVKNIPEWDDVEELDYDRILPDIHTFLKDYPSHWWKKQPSDTPLRTVKTLLHTLVKMKGYDLLPHVKKVKGITPESEMSTYCNKLLRTLKVVDNAASDAQDKKEKCKARRMPKSFRDQLSDIFIKIGSKTETKEGLRMLYEFKQQHPDADIQPFLEKSTKFFQDYIQRGLQAIEVEQRHNTDTTAPARHLNYTDSQSEKDTVQVSNNKELDEPPLVDGVGVGMGEEVDDNPEMQQLQQFMKRLRVLQAKANLLPNATSDSNAVSMATSQPASPPPNDVDLLPSRKPVFDTIVNESPEKKSPDSKSMESLRQRLEKIKQGARLDTSS